MTKKTVLLASVAVSLLVLAGCSSAVGKTQNSSSEKPKVTNEVTNRREVSEAQTTEIGQDRVFTAFTQERYSQLLGKKPFAIFFHASWCSICVQLTKDINSNLASFPEGTVILQADFDTETKLKQTYGVGMQSTIVVIDKIGNVTQSLLGPSIDQLRTAIAESL